MSRYRETAFVFPSGDAELVAILTSPVTNPVTRPPGSTVETAGGTAHALGVLIVVGGPQYRVGSHRQFVLLARALARRGFPVMRFDCSGMGDSGGAERAFTDRDDDIRAAVDAFMHHAPVVEAVAIWGLCDAASAALLYAPGDPRVAHLVLLNPWVRSEAGLARTQLRHYYASRFLDRAFWSDLLRGRIGVLRALKGLVATLVAARAGGRADARSRSSADARETRTDFPTRMAEGWRRFRGDILLIRSGDDLTAREFSDHAAGDAAWAGLVEGNRVARSDLPDADHTFSRAEWRDRVAECTADWLLQRLDGRSTRRRERTTGATGRAREPA